MGYVLDESTTVQCPHGSPAVVVATQARVRLGGKRALTEADPITVPGCPFIKANVPSPCTRVQWLPSKARAKAAGSPVLTSDTVGLFVGPDGAPQGVAQFRGYQTRVRAS